MNTTETVQILGKDYPKKNIKYSYVGSKMRYKRLLKYPVIFFLLITLVSGITAYMVANYFDFAEKQEGLSAISQIHTLNVLVNIANACRFLTIFTIIAFIILLIPRISCLFLKINGIKKDIILYKSIHKDEVALIANEINTKIKENDFSSFPY